MPTKTVIGCLCASRILKDKVILITGADKGHGRILAQAFAASMKALEMLSHRAALQLNPHGIRVYAVDEAGDTIVETVFALLEE